MPTDPTDADLDSLLCRIDATGAPAGLCPNCQRTPPAALARTTANLYRRAFSESKLLEILPYHLAPGTTYHVLTGGDIDALSFLKHVIRAQPLDYCMLSTWCMALDDVAQIADWLTTGRLRRLDVYVGEIFPGSYAAEHRALVPVIRAHGGRVAVFRNRRMVEIALGRPDRIYTRTTEAGTTDVWAYLDERPRFTVGVGVGFGEPYPYPSPFSTVLVDRDADYPYERLRLEFTGDTIKALERIQRRR
jgi:hypothetical protein